MTLPAQILEQFFGASAILMEQRASEKRRKGRFPLSMAAQLCTLERAVVGKPMPMRVRDLSGDGIGFVRSSGMRVADHCVVGLPQKDAGEAWIECEVVRSSPLNNGRFLIGATFEKLLEHSPFTHVSKVRVQKDSLEMARIRKAILS